MPDDDKFWTALRRLEEKLDDHGDTITATRESVVRIEAELKFRPACTKPNLCIEHEPRLAAVETAVNGFKAIQDKGSGSWATLVMLGSTALSLFTLYILWRK